MNTLGLDLQNEEQTQQIYPQNENIQHLEEENDQQLIPDEYDDTDDAGSVPLENETGEIPDEEENDGTSYEDPDLQEDDIEDDDVDVEESEDYLETPD